MNARSMLTPDGHFLSPTNPSATADQRDLEALAIKVFQLPAVVAARQQAAGRWKTCMGRNVPAEAWSRFDQFIDEWCFSYVLRAVNSDANYPKVLSHLFAPPHEWFGMKVPGSRAGGGDSPDNNYMVVPIDGRARFELSGRCFDPRPADAPFVVTGDVSLASTLGIIDYQDLKINPDGSFTVTLDPEPANGRPNHIQTRLESRYLFLRDARSDWHQVSIAYRIKRLDPPAAPPKTIEQMAEHAAQYMVFEVPALYLFNRIMDSIPQNVVIPPFNTGTVGGLVSQMMSLGRVKLADDEAFVVTTQSGGASYRGLVLVDHEWLDSLDYWSHGSHMNVAQAAPNADGSTTYVISIRDPGVHNWLDTCGFHTVGVMHRWQGLPKQANASAPPSLKGELVKLADLDRVLPQQMVRVTPDQRRQQLADRLKAFKLRFVDH